MKKKANREALEAQALHYQEEINQTLLDIKETAKSRGSQILLAGGVLAGGYLLYSLLSSSDKAEKKSKPKEEEGSALGSVLTSYALALALSLAKDKILAYLEGESD